MSTRTEIYLTDEQRRRIDELADAEGVTMAEIIRWALDDQANPDAALAATFGAAPDISVPDRDEWDRGSKQHYDQNWDQRTPPKGKRVPPQSGGRRNHRGH